MHIDPQFEGQCAFALSIGKRGVVGFEKYQLSRAGKVYLFSNLVAKLLFQVLPGRLAKAEKTWSDVAM